jgi:hypothetical protein
VLRRIELAGKLDDNNVVYEIESPEFLYRVTLRVFGVIEDLDEISRKLGLSPTLIHRRGERRGPRSLEYKEDTWQYTPSVDEREPLSVHLRALWSVIEHKVSYVKELKDSFGVDISCGFRTNCHISGLEVPSDCLEMFVKLGIPFGFSIIIF